MQHWTIRLGPKLKCYVPQLYRFSGGGNKVYFEPLDGAECPCAFVSKAKGSCMMVEGIVENTTSTRWNDRSQSTTDTSSYDASLVTRKVQRYNKKVRAVTVKIDSRDKRRTICTASRLGLGPYQVLPRCLSRGPLPCALIGLRQIESRHWNTKQIVMFRPRVRSNRVLILLTTWLQCSLRLFRPNTFWEVNMQLHAQTPPY